MSVVVRMEMPKWCLDCPCVNGEYGYCQADKEERQIEDPNERPSWCPIIAASPWHRVEEELPPKATWVLTVATDENVKLFNIATVDAGGQWWTCSPQKILRELYGVRYWMPIEPPKEDA